MADGKPLIPDNPWAGLRRFTAARIALGRVGVSVPTSAQLEFQLAHARARDAVHMAFDADGVAAALQPLGLETVSLQSAAGDRHIYLQRPDLGRRLSDASRDKLQALRAWPARHDVAFVVADGLSALAVHRHAAALIAAVQKRMARDWRIAPVALVHQGRVAIGDEVGELLQADIVVVLIGERPGLSSPDSLGLYITWSPRPGLTDAARNCISNVRAEGLAIDDAAATLHYLMTEARRRRISGVALKDETDDAGAELLVAAPNFLLDAPQR